MIETDKKKIKGWRIFLDFLKLWDSISVSTSKVLLRCSHARSFAHCLGLLWQSWAIMTETTPPTKPKGVSIQPWMERAGWPLMWLCLEKETATYSSVLAWRIPGTREPGGLPSMGSHRVGHDWSNLAAAAAAAPFLGHYPPCQLAIGSLREPLSFTKEEQPSLPTPCQQGEGPKKRL